MNEKEIKELLDKAEQSIKAGELLYKDKFYDFSASRSYYAMFYSIQAILLSKDMSYSKHSAVISAFGRDFVKTGLIDKKYHQYILDAFDLRNAGDYGALNSIVKEQAEQLIINAKELFKVISKFLNFI